MMSKTTPPRPPQSPSQRQPQPDARALLHAARRRAEAAAASPQSAARRGFIKGAAGTIAGFSLVAAGSHAQDIPADAARGGDSDLRLKRKSYVTLFFNLSHLNGAETTTDHYFYSAGRKYALARIADAPEVLAASRRTNAFLRAVPDARITHHAVGVYAPSNRVVLAYLTCNENPDAGTWEMTGMSMHTPNSSKARAYREARILTPQGPLPLSGKRRMYGATAATTLKDLQDEGVLVDTMSFAEAIVGLHPDILSVEAASASHIQANYVSQDSNAQALGMLVLPGMGPAVPEGAANVSGLPPWATLQPLLDTATHQPYKKSDGKLNQYYPDWDPAVEQYSVPAVLEIHPLVRNDPSLGMDVTAFNLNGLGPQPPVTQTTGKLWARHDGIATIERSATAVATTGAKLVFTNQSAETGLVVTNPKFGTAADGRIQITLDEVSNWFLRWLGVWVQFLDQNQNVIEVSTLPADTYPAEPGPYPRGVDIPQAIFLGAVAPAFTLMGIPVQPGTFAPTINMPRSAASIRVLYTGLGLAGSPLQAPLDDIYTTGLLMTGAFNYGVVGFFMAIGSSDYSPVVKAAVSIGGGAVAQAISTLVGGIVNQKDFIADLGSFTMGFLKVLFQAGTGKILVPIIEAMTVDVAEAEVLDSVPVAGQIARALAAVVGAIQLAETSIECAISPPAYVFDCVATHGLSVTFLPDKSNGQFPQPSPGYTLYYKVSYLFDNGTAHTQSAVTLDAKATSIPIAFADIPYGGQVNVSIGLYMRKDSTPPGQNDWCAGYATTGLTPNTVDQVAPPAGDTGFRITEIKIPIQSTTRYVHTRKTVLDAQGNHVWATDPDGTHAPPYVPPPGGQVPGLGAFESITVRQATSTQQGYVGYSWAAFSSGVNGCGANAPGQFDQMANLNTDAGNGGRNAQNGYVSSQSLCGYNAGVRLGYNLLTHKSLNLYVDTTKLMIRPVSLDPPGFAGPASQQSFGMLNNGSTRCLLHPSGHIVSIDNAHHKIETLKLPASAQPDDIAAQYFLARTYSGMGTAPGRIISPVALAISPDGVILVLEDGTANNRIQAFDLGGNPVPYFKKQPVPYYLELDATRDGSYLDLAVEFSGYLYVMSADSNNVHRLDIYHPLQSGTAPICTTLNINAAKLAVDFWRSVYALNYQVLQLPNGNIPDFTEPSVSMWVPPPPA